MLPVEHIINDQFDSTEHSSRLKSIMCTSSIVNKASRLPLLLSVHVCYLIEFSPAGLYFSAHQQYLIWNHI